MTHVTTRQELLSEFDLIPHDFSPETWHKMKLLAASFITVRKKARTCMLALESLTPQGPEFVGNPAGCVAYVKDRRRSQHELIMRQVDRLRTLADQCEPVRDPLMTRSLIVEAERDQLAMAILQMKDCAENHGVLCHCGRDARDAALKAYMESGV